MAESVSPPTPTSDSLISALSGTGVDRNSSSLRGWQPQMGDSSSRDFHVSSTQFRTTISNPEFPSLVRVSNRRKVMNLTQDLTLNKLQFPSENNMLYGRDTNLQMLQEAIQRAIASKNEEEEGGEDAATTKTTRKPRKACLLISGESGVGKSSLARKVTTYAKECLTTRKIETAVLIKGCFVETHQNKPYLAIGDAVAELCGKILALSTRTTSCGKSNEIDSDTDTASLEYNNLRNRILSEMMEEDLIAMAKVLPILLEITNGSEAATKAAHGNKSEDVTSSSEPESVCIQSNEIVTEERKNRFHQAFRKFLTIVLASKSFSNLIILLDDLQWADQPSLDLLESLFLDAGISNLYIVVTSRPEGVSSLARVDRNDAAGNENPVAIPSSVQTLEAIKRHASSFDFEYVHDEIGNLRIQDIHEMLQDLLRSNDTEVLGLAEVCHRKTGGNAFFLKQYLCLLNEKLLLDFNMGTLKWMWNDAEIEAKTQATENVVDMMKESMDEIPEEVAVVLQLAACLGSSFRISTLRIIWEQYCRSVRGNSNDKITRDLDCHIKIAIDKGFFIEYKTQSASMLQSLSSDSIQHERLLWVHSKIMESAIDYIPADDSKKLRGTVGEILFASLGSAELDEAIFVVADLVNDGNKGSKNAAFTNLDSLAMAKVNLQAVEKAIAMAAFECAAMYAESGIQCVEQCSERWSDANFNTTLKLYSLAAESQSITGNFAKAESNCTEVLQQQKVSIEDKAQIYFVLVEMLFLRNRLEEAKSVCLDILSKLGCRFPRSRFRNLIGSVIGLQKIKMTANTRTIAEVERLPLLKDRKKEPVFHLMDRLLTTCYMLKDPLMLAVLLRLHEWSLKYGISMCTPATMGTIGLMMAAFLTDFDTARVYGECSLAMLDKFEDKSTLPRVYISTWAGALHHAKPIHSILKPLQESYDVGMAFGQFSRGLHSLNLYLHAALVAGRPLALLEYECRLFSGQMKSFRQELLLDFDNIFLALILALRVGAPSENGNEDSESSTNKQEAPDRNAVHKAYYDTFQLQEAVYFQDFERAVELATKNAPITKTVPACCLGYSENLLRGISYCEMARRRKFGGNKGTGKTSAVKLKRLAHRILRTIKKWVERGNPNVQHHEALLEAEWAALTGKKAHIVCKHYDTAIVLASRHGFIHDAALANERQGEYLLREVGDRENAVYRLEEAVKLYQEWGANAKANHVLKKHQDIWRVPETVFAIE